MIFGGYFDVDNKKSNLSNLENNLQDMYKDNKWNTKESIDLSKKISEDKKIISNVEKLNQTLTSYLEVIELKDNDLINEISSNIENLKKQINSLEIETKLSSKTDKENAILEIHSGAGGTESCDWAQLSVPPAPE